MGYLDAGLGRNQQGPIGTYVERVPWPSRCPGGVARSPQAMRSGILVRVGEKDVAVRINLFAQGLDTGSPLKWFLALPDPLRMSVVQLTAGYANQARPRQVEIEQAIRTTGLQESPVAWALLARADSELLARFLPAESPLGADLFRIMVAVLSLADARRRASCSDCTHWWHQLNSRPRGWRSWRRHAPETVNAILQPHEAERLRDLSLREASPRLATCFVVEHFQDWAGDIAPDFMVICRLCGDIGPEADAPNDEIRLLRGPYYRSADARAVVATHLAAVHGVVDRVATS